MWCVRRVIRRAVYGRRITHNDLSGQRPHPILEFAIQICLFAKRWDALGATVTVTVLSHNANHDFDKTQPKLWLYVAFPREFIVPSCLWLVIPCCTMNPFSRRWDDCTHCTLSLEGEVDHPRFIATYLEAIRSSRMHDFVYTKHFKYTHVFLYGLWYVRSWQCSSVVARASCLDMSVVVI